MKDYIILGLILLNVIQFIRSSKKQQSFELRLAIEAEHFKSYRVLRSSVRDLFWCCLRQPEKVHSYVMKLCDEISIPTNARNEFISKINSYK